MSKFVLYIYAYGHFTTYKVNIPIIKQVLYFIYRILNVLIVEMLFNSAIDGRTVIGDNFQLDHPFGVIISNNAIIGNDVTVRHQVTIGNVQIGNNVSIGANSVVTHDVDDNTVVAGIPARVIKHTNS